MKILYAEDDKLSALLVEAILKKKDYEVTSVSSGREAIDHLKEGESFDLVISDIMMPEIDGIGLLKYIRNSNRYKNIPVIMTTALNDQNIILKAIGFGIEGYLVKPITGQKLIAKIDEVVENGSGSVLVVDDELIIRSLLTNVLERDGFKVETAVDGLDAIEKLKSKKISLIISDIKMPQMSGIELLVEVKENFSEIPILLMTGYKLEFTKAEAISSGADGFISKPFKNVEIIHKIRTCLLHTKKKIVQHS